MGFLRVWGEWRRLISPHRRACGPVPLACRLPLKGGVMRAALKHFVVSTYYKRARYGFCRGGQPVHYVENIQSLYDAYVTILENAR